MRKVAFYLLFLLVAASTAAAKPAKKSISLKNHRHKEGVSYVDFSPDGKHLLSSGSTYDSEIRIWDLTTHKKIGSIKATCCEGAAFTGNDTFAWVETFPQQLVRAKVGKKPAETGRTKLSYVPAKLAVSAGGARIAIGEQAHVKGGPPKDGEKVRLYEGDREVWACPAESHQVGSLAFTPDGAHVLFAGTSSYVGGKLMGAGASRLLDAESGKSVRTFNGNSVLACSRDGKRVASPVGLFDEVPEEQRHTIGVWETASGAGQVFLKKPKSLVLVRCLAFSKDSRYLFAGGDWKKIVVYDLSTGAGVRQVLVDTKACRCMALSPDGKWLATGGEKRLKLWNVEALTAAKK